MRTIPANTVTQCLSTSRQVSASLVAYQTLPKFSENRWDDPDLIGWIADDIEDSFYDSDDQGNGYVMRVSASGSTWTLKYNYVDIDGTWTSWLDSGIVLYKGSRAAVYGNRLFYQVGNGQYYYRDFTHTGGGVCTFGAATTFTPSIAATDKPVAFAPVSENEVYVIVPDDMSSLTGQYESRIAFYNVSTSAEKLFPGEIYDYDSTITSERVREIDAERFNGKDYLFIKDKDNRRVMFTCRVLDHWSELRPVLPIDIVDDTARLDLGAVSLVNGYFVLTGGMRRESAVDGMEAYMVGPEQFTQGRELYIRDYPRSPRPVRVVGGYTLPDWPGKMFYDSSAKMLHYIGIGRRYSAKSTVLLNAAHADTYASVTAINSINLANQINNPSTLRFEVSAANNSPLLVPGNMIRLSFVVNSQAGTFGDYTIDAKIRSKDNDGSGYMIIARSDTGKRMSQWRSDADFDYWSQSKVCTNPATLSDVILTGGQFTTTGDVLRLKDLHRSAFIYSSERPGRNGIAKATFNIPSGVRYFARVGVGLCYYRETVAETAERVSTDTSKVTDDMIGSNAVLLTYSDMDGPSEAAGFSLWRVVPNDGVGQQLSGDPDNHRYYNIARYAATLNRNTDYDLRIEFFEGHIRSLYKATSSNTWILLGTVRYTQPIVSPWGRSEQVGRGVIYMKNLTQADFGSGSGAISVRSVNSTSNVMGISGSPSTPCDLLVDDEVIGVSSTEGVGGDQFDRNVVEGYTLQGATKPGYQGPFAGAHHIYCQSYGPALDHDYFNNCALVAVSGGNTFKVTDYDQYAPDQWVPSQTYTPPDNWINHVGDPAHGSWVASNMHRWFFDDDPSGKISPGSVIRVYRLANISERGKYGTFSSNHVSASAYYYEDKQVACKRFWYYSGDMDMTLEYIARELARKAGVLSFSSGALMSGQYIYTRTGRQLSLDLTNKQHKRSAILSIKPMSWSGNIGVVFGSDGTTISKARAVLVDTTWVRIYNVDGTTFSLAEDIPLSQTLAAGNEITISIQQPIELDARHWDVSVWADGKLIAATSVNHDNETLAVTNEYMYISPSTSMTFNAYWSELDSRVDNFIFDRGKTALSLLNDLIGEKPIYFTTDNGLRVFRQRQTVNSGNPYLLSVSSAETTSDIDLVTRLLLEGAEIVADYDHARLVEHGNLFGVAHSSELNSLWDLEYEIERLLDESDLAYEQTQFTGAADPRIEPGDKIEASIPTPERVQNRTIVVDGITFNLYTNEEAAIFDMIIEGRDA